MLNICQVSLARDIPIILENYLNFKNHYTSFKVFVICPLKDIDKFKKKLNYNEFNFIDENSIITFDEFSSIFEDTSNSVEYKSQFKERLGWYYQQILKLSFVFDFVESKKENLVIWDADTVILKKIDFFKNEYSIKYATLFEFHKHYFKTNEGIVGKNPNYFISSLTQFIGITNYEYKFLMQNILKVNPDIKKDKTSFFLSKIILNNIFKNHKIYNGSLFSEYELIGISNYALKKEKQIPLFTLRTGLDGKLTKGQAIIAKLMGVMHVTYEHSYLDKYSQGMLDRKQSLRRFFVIIIKEFIKFNLRNLRHNFNFYYSLISR